LTYLLKRECQNGTLVLQNWQARSERPLGRQQPNLQPGKELQPKSLDSEQLAQNLHLLPGASLVCQFVQTCREPAGWRESPPCGGLANEPGFDL